MKLKKTNTQLKGFFFFFTYAKEGQVNTEITEYFKSGLKIDMFNNFPMIKTIFLNTGSLVFLPQRGICFFSYVLMSSLKSKYKSKYKWLSEIRPDIISISTIIIICLCAGVFTCYRVPGSRAISKERRIRVS